MEVMAIPQLVHSMLAVGGTGNIVGFMCLDEAQMKALFVDPISHALHLQPALTTDVNAPNESTTDFYARMVLGPSPILQGIVRAGLIRSSICGMKLPPDNWGNVIRLWGLSRMSCGMRWSSNRASCICCPCTGEGAPGIKSQQGWYPMRSKMLYSAVMLA